jgi:hypothetical protein
MQNVKTEQKTNQITIAYFILVHRLPEQFKRLFKAIYHPENHYLIHIDKKTDIQTRKNIQTFLTGHKNTHLLESSNVTWGGYSMIQAELDGMKHLLGLNQTWDFFINLSGQDYPLKSQNIIRNFLTKNRQSNYIKVINQAKERPETMNRIEHHFTETSIGFQETKTKRKYLQNTVPYIGGQWMILTRSCCEFICNSGESKKFEEFYKNTLIADESFFQTVLMNTSFKEKIINNDKRAIVWIPDGNIKLRPKTFTQQDLDFLQTGDNLFARKFDDQVDPYIINMIKTHFHVP